MRVIVIADAQYDVGNLCALAVLHDTASCDEAEQQGQRYKNEQVSLGFFGQSAPAVRHVHPALSQQRSILLVEVLLLMEQLFHIASLRVQ